MCRKDLDCPHHSLYRASARYRKSRFVSYWTRIVQPVGHWWIPRSRHKRAWFCCLNKTYALSAYVKDHVQGVRYQRTSTVSYTLRLCKEGKRSCGPPGLTRKCSWSSNRYLQLALFSGWGPRVTGSTNRSCDRHQNLSVFSGRLDPGVKSVNTCASWVVTRWTRHT